MFHIRTGFAFGSRGTEGLSLFKQILDDTQPVVNVAQEEVIFEGFPSVPRKSTVAARDKNDRMQRSASARKAFMTATGYPKGRKGHVVDHILPLERGCADVPSNMQWQTVQEAKIKDRTERNCRRE